jgi:hypothetical protein
MSAIILNDIAKITLLPPFGHSVLCSRRKRPRVLRGCVWLIRPSVKIVRHKKNLNSWTSSDQKLRYLSLLSSDYHGPSRSVSLCNATDPRKYSYSFTHADARQQEHQQFQLHPSSSPTIKDGASVRPPFKESFGRSRFSFSLGRQY